MGWRDFVGDAGEIVEPRALRRQRAVPGAVRAVRLHRRDRVVAAAHASLVQGRAPTQGVDDRQLHAPATDRSMKEHLMSDTTGRALRRRRRRLARRPVAASACAPATCSSWSRQHVVGVTTNPTIFAEGASARRDAYDDQLRDLAVRGVDVERGACARSPTYDVRWACDVLRPVYDAPTASTAGSPSRSTRGSRTTPTQTIAEARALWWLVDRPNLFIKIPATERGPAGDHRRRSPRASASTSR